MSFMSKPAVAAAGIALGLAAFSAAASAQQTTVSTFATGAAVGATAPDSITVGGGSVWAEYGNGVDSTGADGKSSTIVRYNQTTGAVQKTFSILGSVDGLNYDASSGTVYALQNQDGNPTLSTINPLTNTISGPRSYAALSGGRGYDEYAFAGGKTFASYTNPANPTDPIIQQVQPGADPITATTVLTYGATGKNIATGAIGAIVANDPDSLKVRPNGDLQLSSGDDGTLIFVKNAGLATQSVSFLQLTSAGAAVSGLDDAQTVTSTSGTFYLAETKTNDILKIDVTGLTVGSLYADVGSTNAFELVDQGTGALTPLLSGLGSPHGLAFVEAVPEPASMALLGGGLVGLFAARRRRA